MALEGLEGLDGERDLEDTNGRPACSYAVACTCAVLDVAQPYCNLTRMSSVLPGGGNEVVARFTLRQGANLVELCD